MYITQRLLLVLLVNIGLFTTSIAQQDPQKLLSSKNEKKHTTSSDIVFFASVTVLAGFVGGKLGAYSVRADIQAWGESYRRLMDEQQTWAHAIHAISRSTRGQFGHALPPAT